MRVGKFLMAAAVASMTVAPAFAAPANPAAKLSLSKSVRASSTSSKKSKAVETGVIIGVIAAVAVVGGVIAATSNSNSTPKSP